MNSNKILPDDPRLTAYALEEMSAGERTEFEQLLKDDAAAQAAVAEIREAGALFTQALADEPVAMIEEVPMDEKISESRGEYDRKFNGFPYWKISGALAAGFAVAFVIWQQGYVPPRKSKLIELSLPTESATLDAGSVQDKPIGDSAAIVPMPEGIVAQSREWQERQQSALPTATTARADGDQSGRGKPSGTFAYVKPLEEETVVLSPMKVRDERGSSYGGGGVAILGGAANGANSRRMKSVTLAAPAAADTASEAYAYRKDSGFQRVADQPLSTFSIDVDTASYANVRRFLTQGKRPPADAVRIEELVNYFPYASYQAPVGDTPFAANLEVASAPWAPEHRLVRIGLKGREVSEAVRPAANLVFLLDVSGSMNEPNKLPLVQKSLRLLVEKLRPQDRVAIAVYAGSSGMVLPSTPASRRAEILAAIDGLRSGGSTNGALGIHLAYDLARANFIAEGVNRVILATDGDFNVGTTSEGELVRLIEEKARSGVYLSVLGFGMGNLKDSTLEQLADKGNGNYAYIDSLAEARKTLVEQAGGTLVTIAKDVKLQVEFNPAVVQAYRLIGYENRLLAKEDFKNDAVDAGEIGAGHTVTALYEVVPVGATLPGVPPVVDELKYQKVVATGAVGEADVAANGRLSAGVSGEMLTVKVRYKEPAGDVSQLREFPLRDGGGRFEAASPDFKFAASVAAFGMVLRASPEGAAITLAEVSRWAREGTGLDAGGYRTEFLSLVDAAGRAME